METEFILYVADQQRSMTFYSTLLNMEPTLNVPGMTEFTIAEKVKLGLMPETGINKILDGKTPTPMSGAGIPRCELYLKIKSIDTFCERAVKAGAKIVSEKSPRDWGDTVAYFGDPDGHIIAFAQSTS